MNQQRLPLVIYHGPVCNDGFASALAAYRYFGKDGCEFKSMNYGKERDAFMHEEAHEELVRNRDVYILDFSFMYNQILRIADKALQVVLLDHHATAREELGKSLDMEGNTWDYSNKNIFIKFDMQKAGCILSWEFFAKLKADYIHTPNFIQHLGNYDIWNFKPGDDTDALTTAIGMYPRDFSTWMDFVDTPLNPHAAQPLIHDGRAILKYNSQRMDELVQHTRRFKLLGKTVEILNAPYYLASRLGNKIVSMWPTEEVHGACLFTITDKGTVICSFRSGGQNANNGVAKELAEHFGGGGHPNAAGCELRLADFITSIWNNLEPAEKA